jgi:hypothetical protein
MAIDPPPRVLRTADDVEGDRRLVVPLLEDNSSPHAAEDEETHARDRSIRITHLLIRCS